MTIIDGFLNLSPMPSLPASLFVKEPGKTRTLVIENESLKKSSKNLKLADVLEIKRNKTRFILFSQKFGEVAEIKEPDLVAKLNFAIESKSRLEAIFVGGTKNSSGKPCSQFIIRCSLPIFANEKTSGLKPFWRGADVNQEEKPNEEKVPAEILNEEEHLNEDETNPLAGLNIIEGEKPSHSEVD